MKQLKLLQLFFSLERTLQAALPHKRKYTPPQIAQQDGDSNFIFFEAFSCEDFETILTPRYRKLAMNIQDPRIQEGQRITLDAIREMKQLADSRSIRFLVLLLPTKERAFYDLYPQYNLEPSESIRSTVELNDEIRELSIGYLQEYEIPYIDTLPVLRGCFEQKQQPFFENADGHLNSIGHDAIAKAVHEYIINNR